MHLSRKQVYRYRWILIAGIALVASVFVIQQLIIVSNVLDVTYALPTKVYREDTYTLPGDIYITYSQDRFDNCKVHIIELPVDVTTPPILDLTTSCLGNPAQYDPDTSKFIFHFTFTKSIALYDQAQRTYLIEILASPENDYTETFQYQIILEKAVAPYLDVDSVSVNGIPATQELIVSGQVIVHMELIYANYIIDPASVKLKIIGAPREIYGSFTRDVAASTTVKDVYNINWDTRSVPDGIYTLSCVFTSTLRTRSLQGDTLDQEEILFSIRIGSESDPLLSDEPIDEPEKSKGLIPGFDIVLTSLALVCLIMLIKRKGRDSDTWT